MPEKGVRFDIRFNKSSKTYRPGEKVICTIYVTITETFWARSLFLEYVGVAHTEWDEQQDDPFRKRFDQFYATQEFFKRYYYFFGRSGNGFSIIEKY